MSYAEDLEKSCPNIQGALKDMWSVGPFPGADERIPFAEFLVSPANRREIVPTILPGSSKVRTVEMRYRQRLLESEVEENVANPKCEASTQRGSQIHEVTMDTEVNLSVSELFDLRQNMRACVSDPEWMAEKISYLIDGLDRIVATNLTNQAAVLTGPLGQSVTLNGSDELEVVTRVKENRPSDEGWMDLRNALDDSGFPQDVGIFGGGEMRKFMQRMNKGCCSSYGLDLGEIMAEYGYAYGHDLRVKTALGNDQRFLIVAPGALQVLNWSGSEGKPISEIWGMGANYAYFTLQSPRLGLLYDVTAKDDCGQLSLSMIATNKVIGMPSDMFAVGDEYEGITYVAKGLAVSDCTDPCAE